MLADFMEDSQHGNVGFSRASWSTDEKVFVGVIGCLEHYGLDPVQSLHPFEYQLPDLSRESTKRNMT